MGSVGPEAGSGRKPPAAPRDRAPASSSSSSSTSSAAKGAGASPPVPAALFVPAARGRTRAHLPPPPQPPNPVERRRRGSALARGRAGAARAPSVRQAASTRTAAAAAPAPPPLARSLARSPARPPARNLLTARPGGAERSRAGRREAERAGGSRVPAPRPAERPPHRGSRSAGRRHPPAAARHCTAACDFRCSTLPGRSLGGGFFSRPPGPPPRLPPFPQGRFLGALPPPQRSGARAGRAGGRGKAAGPGPAWGAAGAGAAALFAPGAALLSQPRSSVSGAGRRVPHPPAGGRAGGRSGAVPCAALPTKDRGAAWPSARPGAGGANLLHFWGCGVGEGFCLFVCFALGLLAALRIFFFFF